MTPDEFAALMDQYTTKREDVSPEVWESMQEAQRYTQEKIDKGEVLKSWSKENFPIGLDSNFEPFPLTGPDRDQGHAGGETRQ
ncbi:hypothetical protein [Saccharopolyspora sp. ASAGF58]|uniref:hypothetical protein n=1 Tax=Saccharopolyspora sp. ASAGF58 TaxID=2719023 RepID=UPI0014400A5E|nr:hypothetical protein [Saccharopolyspora sp. ASAGF58]QIZ34997.1 hypothetical protein FDZ84_09985 [Saccharopolyspora sp. ASAGF58]